MIAAGRLLGLLPILFVTVLAAKAGEPAPEAAAPASAPAATPAEQAAVQTPPASVTAALAANEAAGLLRLAGSLAERSDYVAGEIAYRQILDRKEFTQAEKKDALLGLARMYRKQGLATKAAAIFEKFLKDFADDARTPEILLDLGRTLRDMGAYRLAISRFYSVINSTLKIAQSESGNYQVLARTAQFEIAETHFQAGDFVEAGKFFGRLRLLELAPVDRARAHFMAGRAQRLSGDLETAVQTFRTFLDQWPDAEQTAEVCYLLAITLRDLKRSDEALAATRDLLSAAHKESGSNPRLWSYWQRRTGNQLANDFFQSGNINGALTLYEALAALSEDPAWRLPVTYQIALCHERLRDTPRAEATYRQVVDAINTLGDSAGPELREVGRMAAWRLNQLSWYQKTSLQLSAQFSPHLLKDKDDAAGSTAAAPRTE